MLKRAFALSDQGAKDLAKGIIATACANLIQIIPASLLLMVVMMLLEKAAGTQVNVGRNIPFFVGITLVLFGMIAIAQLVQYNLTYTAAYAHSFSLSFWGVGTTSPGCTGIHIFEAVPASKTQRFPRRGRRGKRCRTQHHTDPRFPAGGGGLAAGQQTCRCC